MPNPPNCRQPVLSYLTERLGTQPVLTERANQRDEWSVGIASFMHAPSQGLATHATIGLGELSLSFADGAPFPGGLEVMALTNASTSNFDKCLAAIAFHLFQTGEICIPGNAFRGMLAQAIPGVTVPHLLCDSPFIWDGGVRPIKTLPVNGRSVYWQMVVPISDAELQLLQNSGPDALRSRLAKANTDIADLWRRSVV